VSLVTGTMRKCFDFKELHEVGVRHRAFCESVTVNYANDRLVGVFATHAPPTTDDVIAITAPPT